MKKNKNIQIVVKPGHSRSKRQVSYSLCRDPRYTHYLDENAARLLQVTEGNKQSDKIHQHHQTHGHTTTQTTQRQLVAFDFIFHSETTVEARKDVILMQPGQDTELLRRLNTTESNTDKKNVHFTSSEPPVLTEGQAFKKADEINSFKMLRCTLL